MNEKNADMDDHAVPPPQYQPGGDSKSENLCQQDSIRVSKVTLRASSSRQLEAAGVSSSGLLVATEDPSNGKKVHLHPNTDGEKYIRKFDDLSKYVKPQSVEETNVHNLVNILLTFKNSRSALRFGTNSRAAYGLHLRSQKITKEWR